MTYRNTALWLAEELEQRFWPTSTHYYLDKKAANELRRQHEEIEKFREHIASQSKELDELIPMAERLEVQRAALLASLKLMVEQFTKTPSTFRDSEARVKAHAAIKQAEE